MLQEESPWELAVPLLRMDQHRPLDRTKPLCGGGSSYDAHLNGHPRLALSLSGLLAESTHLARGADAVRYTVMHN